MIKPIKIGNLKLNSNIFLAPMAEITNYPFRKIALKNGADLVISEMVSSKAVFYNNKKSIQLIEIRDDRPICIQIFGSDVNSMLYTAKMVEKLSADMIEINAGCPVKKITKTGAGISLMKDTILLSNIIQIIRKNIKIPVSVKIRTGIDEKNKNSIKIAKIIEESGADIIHIHMRTAAQKHSGDVDYDTTAEIKQKINIPIIANGGITSPEKAVECFKKTNCDAISIARGAISNPFIFSEIKSFIKMGKIQEKTLSDKINCFIEYLNISSQTYGEKYALVNSRRIIGMWISNFPNASKIRNEFMKATDLVHAKELLLNISTIH